jgi:hypothetical protein
MIVQHEVEVSLHSLPYEQWPEEAKRLARVILLRPSIRAQLRQQLFPLDWLAAQVERHDAAARAAYAEFLS